VRRREGHYLLRSNLSGSRHPLGILHPAHRDRAGI
jgi:hypothetical protein